MPRRRTTIGQGPFGRPVPVEQHAAEILDRIANRRLPITEDATFLFLYHVLRRNNNSEIFQKVQVSKDTGGYRYFRLSPDIDLLEVRPNGKVVGYELKGCLKSGMSWNPPSYPIMRESIKLWPCSKTPSVRQFPNPLLAACSTRFTSSTLRIRA